MAALSRIRPIRSEVNRWFICAATLGIFWGVLRIANADEPTPEATAPTAREYLVDVHLCQRELSVAGQNQATRMASIVAGSVLKAFGFGDEAAKDNRKTAKVLASPRILLRENQQAEVRVGDDLGIGDDEFVHLGTDLSIRVEQGNRETVHVTFTLSRTTGRCCGPMEAPCYEGWIRGAVCIADTTINGPPAGLWWLAQSVKTAQPATDDVGDHIGIEEGIRIHGNINVELGKTVKVCVRQSDEQRIWLELTVYDGHPESTVATTECRADR